MPDDLTNKGPQDRSRISLLEPHEVQYWADKFNVSKERLSEAVKNVGHSAAAVEKELNNSVHVSWKNVLTDVPVRLDLGAMVPSNADRRQPSPQHADERKGKV
jgi:Protein of unknown function (DUF3606)